MFEFIFGWSKASKCKKLIKKVQCRLHLLKNKRCCIVRQLRNDVSQLIKHGHYQTAFNRVDQIYKDECIVAVYDLLAHFCEFTYLQLSYIRRNKDCPDDINEAISSLIFASARCGDLPELRLLRELFSQRYGQSFKATALELLPGNLVNFQIIENLSIKLVPNEARYKLVEEITTAALQTGPLALEFTSEQHQEATKSNAVQGTGNEQISDVDFGLTTVDKDRYTSRIKYAGAEFSSENSPTNYVSKEIVYLDYIEEFQSPMNNGEKGKEDQRIFVFKSSVIVPMVKNHETYLFNDFDIQQSEHLRSESKVLRRSSPIYNDNTSHRRRASHENRERSGNTYTPGHENHLFDKQVGELGMGSDYSRAMSMPSKRSTKCLDENATMRSNSFPVQPSSPHVHPKLPDYDELAAKFMALKKENLQNQKQISR